MSVFLVRVTGLEPVRHRHTPLKRACLPVPAHSHRPDYITIVKTFCQQLISYFEKLFYSFSFRAQAVNNDIRNQKHNHRTAENCIHCGLAYVITEKLDRAVK